MKTKGKLLRRYIAAANHLILKFQHKIGICLSLGHPISAMVEICNVCNLKCPLCPTGNLDLKRPRGFMEEEVFRMIVDQLDDRYTKNFIPVMWGEALLHPKFLSLMRYARKKDWHISISTNGNVRKDDAWYDEFVAAGIDEVVCAVDGHDQLSYAEYRRGGNLEIVHKFLASLRQARDRGGATTPHLVAQIHLLRSNQDHRQDIERNVDPFVDEIREKKVRTFYTDPAKEAVMMEKGRILKPNRRDLRFAGEGRLCCPSMLYSLNMNWAGDVLACCKDPENVLRFGNIRNSSLKDIRQSQKFIEMRQRLLKGSCEEEVCRRCYRY